MADFKLIWSLQILLLMCGYGWRLTHIPVGLKLGLSSRMYVYMRHCVCDVTGSELCDVKDTNECVPICDVKDTEMCL